MASYMMWFDDDRKKSTTTKIEEAFSAYERRFQRQPNIVLVNEREEMDKNSTIPFRPQSFVRLSHFYVGYEEAA